MNGRCAVLLVLLFVAAPAQAEEAGGSGEPTSGEAGGNQTQNGTSHQSSTMQSSAGNDRPCELVRWYGAARPTYIVVDPDRCFVPAELRELINRLT